MGKHIWNIQTPGQWWTLIVTLREHRLTDAASACDTEGWLVQEAVDGRIDDAAWLDGALEAMRSVMQIPEMN